VKGELFRNSMEMVIPSGREKGGRIWPMHGYFAEPTGFREEVESFINTIPGLSFYAMAASSWEKGGGDWM